MPTKNKKSPEVDRYIIGFPESTRKKLVQIRSLIAAAAPAAEEVISYGMPAYKYNSVLVYFAGYKNHIGFYPTPSGIIKFKKEIDDFEWSKGAVQFPIDKPLPGELIKRIVKFRLQETKNNVKPEKKTRAGGLSKGHALNGVDGLSKPALRALESIGVKTIQQLSKKSKKELLKLHGFGPASIPVLQKALKEKGLSFKE